MCFSKPKTPEVVQAAPAENPKVQAEKASADAQVSSNAQLAQRKSSLRRSALSTGAGLGTSALGYGKSTLGG